MEAQSTWLRIGRWLPLGGAHRARGDAEAARVVPQRLAAPADSPYDASRLTPAATYAAPQARAGHGQNGEGQ